MKIFSVGIGMNRCGVSFRCPREDDDEKKDGGAKVTADKEDPTRDIEFERVVTESKGIERSGDTTHEEERRAAQCEEENLGGDGNGARRWLGSLA